MTKKRVLKSEIVTTLAVQYVSIAPRERVRWSRHSLCFKSEINDKSIHTINTSESEKICQIILLSIFTLLLQ